MSILGIDYGDSRIGLAVAPKGVTFALPLTVIENDGEDRYLKAIHEIIKDENVEEIVIGMPVTMSGGDSEQTIKIRHIVQLFEKTFNIPVHIEDERLSSKLAETYQRQGADKSLHDALAAQAILQTYLDKKS